MKTAKIPRNNCRIRRFHSPHRFYFTKFIFPKFSHLYLSFYSTRISFYLLAANNLIILVGCVYIRDNEGNKNNKTIQRTFYLVKSFCCNVCTNRSLPCEIMFNVNSINILYYLMHNRVFTNPLQGKNAITLKIKLLI